MNYHSLKLQNLAATEFHPLFELVKPAENWKNPIHVRINAKGIDLNTLSDAIIFYTGSVPEFVDRKGDFVTVIADGYYLAIGA